MATKKSTYTPAPEVPPEIQDRYRAVLEVLSGTTSVAEAARRINMPRNHFQTLMHRALQGMILGLTPGKAGRPAKPAREVELEAERDKLLRKTEQLEQRLDMTTRLMNLASEVIKSSSPRSRSSKKRSPSVTTADDESEEPPASLRAIAHRLDDIAVPRAVVARGLGVAEATLRRWTSTPAKAHVTRSHPPPIDAVRAAIEEVRELRGLVGAESLRQAHPELSRRQAARIKQDAVTALERERRATCSRVAVTVPGVVRGFDAMDRGQLGTPRYVLVAADACVPFRTSVVATERYDDSAVACVLDADFVEHGAPIVVRMDRAKAHSAPQTAAVLAAHGVLVLHGPPRHPRFYGQLERQNREHAAWVHVDDDKESEPLPARLERMRSALNVLWRRRALDWKTPAEVWRDRPRVDVDRCELRAQVDAHARKLRLAATQDKITEDLARRLAIEHALMNLGYLRIEIRRPLLGDYAVLKQAI